MLKDALQTIQSKFQLSNIYCENNNQNFKLYMYQNAIWDLNKKLF